MRKSYPSFSLIIKTAEVLDIAPSELFRDSNINDDGGRYITQKELESILTNHFEQTIGEVFDK